MADAEILRNSVKYFEEKKQQTLDFLTRADALANQFARDFPQQDARADHFGMVEIKRVRDKIANEQLRILVAGQFKTGKSTLLNALLGSAILPAYSTPCTAVITEVAYGKEPRAVLYFKEKHGDLPHGLDPRLREHIEKSVEPIPPLELPLASREELEKYLVIDEEAEDQANGVAETPISVCRLFWPLDFGGKDAIIIDSPGLNENGARDKTTMDYVPQADIIIHVLNAQQLWGIPDRKFIDDIELMGRFPVLFLINRFDAIKSEKEQERVRKYAFKNLQDHSLKGSEGIFFISAEEALQGRLNRDEDKLIASRIPDFERAVAKIISEERLKIKLGAVAEVVRDMENMVIEDIPAIESSLNASASELKHKLTDQSGLIERLEKRIERVKNICNAAVKDFQDKLALSLTRLLTDYCREGLGKSVEETDITQYSLANEEDQNRAVAKLLLTVEEDLKRVLSRWAATDYEQLYSEAYKKVEKELSSELEEFTLELGILRKNLTVDPKTGVSSIDMAYVGDGAAILGDGLMLGGMLGGALGLAEIAGWALLPARLLGGIGGPAGLIIINGLIAALGWALGQWLTSQKRDKLKELFIKTVAGDISKHVADTSRGMAQNISKTLELHLDTITQAMTKRINEAKRPILVALEIMTKDQNQIGVKRKELKQYKERLQELTVLGKELAESIFNSPVSQPLPVSE